MEFAKWQNLHVVCAVDTIDKSLYADYRVGGNYEIMLNNLHLLLRGKCNVYAQFLVQKGDDVGPIIRFAKDHGVPTKNIIIKIKRNNFRLDETNKPTQGVCHTPYSGIYFNCDGISMSCCNNIKSDLHIRHISKISSANDILTGEDFAKTRKLLAISKNYYPSCAQCIGETFWRIRLPAYINYLKRMFRIARHNSPQRMPY